MSCFQMKPLVWEDFADLEMIQNPHNSDDNLAIALCSYFEHRIDCPDGDEDGAELDEFGCWKVWAREHTESVLRRIAAKANAAIDLTPTPVDASPAPDPVSKTELTNDERLEYQEALIWCSAAADFAPEGQAREGWLKLCKPLIDRLPVDPVSKTPTLGALAMRRMARDCCDMVFDAAAKEGEAVAASSCRYMIDALPVPDHTAALAEAKRLPEVKALVDVLNKVPRALTEAFNAGMEEREGGSARRQGKCLDFVEAVRTEVAAALKGASHE